MLLFSTKKKNSKQMEKTLKQSKLGLKILKGKTKYMTNHVLEKNREML